MSFVFQNDRDMHLKTWWEVAAGCAFTHVMARASSITLVSQAGRHEPLRAKYCCRGRTGPSVWYFVDLGYGGMYCLPCPHGSRGSRLEARGQCFIDNQRKGKELENGQRKWTYLRTAREHYSDSVSGESLEAARKAIQ